MGSTSLVKRALAPAWVRPEALNVTPELLGMPLAPHGRRALAMGVDLAVIGLLSTTGMFWVVAGIGAIVVQLRSPPPNRPRSRALLMWLALALLIVLAVRHGESWYEHRNDPPRAEAATDDDDDGDATAAAASAASATAAEVALRAAHKEQAHDAARIRDLEAQLAEARKPRPIQWRDAAMGSLHKLGLRFGWAIAYFSLLPFWWKGQTVGKRLFGLRVVELTGKPLGLMTCFGRYGGYAAGLATGGTGFLQVLWDPNRQAVEDKLAHTVVVDLRGPRAA
ncbi:RDD family protein [Scleromatobacter humisilvae]|uniref:RDD family protein n=1 Tax=Scleromatobacter humisilvae TaxID=2897159 RepID=A0A9X1YK87_9BURK|nr:RDD family protein [Scleromatobacter humisilvae]MCK9687446.1 RDD family protein [Scleromatobacter humisilvae]